VIAPVCDCNKEKENWTSVWLQLVGVRDCKPGVMCGCKKTWLCLCGWKCYLVIWNMIASLGSVWLQKLKCVIAKAAGLFLWLQKRKRKLNQCVIATSWRAWLQPGVMCGCKKPWLCLCGWKATWLFGIWLQAWVVCDCKKLKCVIAKSAGLFLWLQKRKRKLNQCVIPTS
jgi:hypothetical protein